MISPRIKNHYSRYPAYWKDFTRENTKGKSCESCGSVKHLTTAHIDQDPNNNQKKTGKYCVVAVTYNSTSPIMCLVK